MLRASAVVLAGLLTACPDDPSPAADTHDPDALACAPVADGETRPLVDHALWQAVAPADDPWIALRPADLDCGAAGKLEDFAGHPAFEVNTQGCSYTTVVQPALAAACQGELLFVWLWNYALTAPDGGTAIIGVQIGSDRVWQGERTIPSSSLLVYDHVVLPHDVPAGTPVYFHVNNHGNNQYELLDLSIVNPAHANVP